MSASSVLTMESQSRTLADVLQDLGDIDARRIRWHPLPGTATVDDVIHIEASENRLFELVEGVLVEKAMGFREALLAIAIAGQLKEFVDSKNLGLVLGADGMMQLFPGLVRIPDVSFISWSRLGGGVPTEQVPLVTPDLAVEVLSPSNTKREMARKCREYFESGAKAVWIVDPTTRTATAHVSPEVFRTFNETDAVPGGDALPGFTMQLKRVFGELDRKPGA